MPTPPSRRAFLVRGAGLAVGAVAFGSAWRHVRAEDMVDVTEQALFDLANAERVRHGSPPVLPDPAVLGPARARAAAQLDRGALSHYDPAGRLAIVGLLAEADVQYRLVGENLARWMAADPSGRERTQEALMRSPGHRRNILEPSFDRLVVGAATDEAGRIAVAQIFRAAP
jgi:uncharacterized protein YkwD